MTPLEQSIYLYLVAPVVREYGAHSDEAEIAYRTWERIVTSAENTGERT